MAVTEIQNAKIGENPFKLEIKSINKDYQMKKNYTLEIRQSKAQDCDMNNDENLLVVLDQYYRLVNYEGML